MRGRREAAKPYLSDVLYKLIIDSLTLDMKCRKQKSDI